MGNLRIVMSIMVLVLCAPSLLLAEGALPVVQGIRVFKSGESLGVEISADKSFEYTCTKMPQLLKIVVDLPKTETGRPDDVYKYRSTLISAVRLEKKTINGGTVARVSVNLNEDADFTIRTDPADPKKVTLMLRKAAPGNAGAAAAQPVKSASAQPSGVKPSAAKASAAAPAAAAASAHKPSPASGGATRPLVPGTSPSVAVTAVSCSADAIDIKSEGSISDFKAFTLQQPGRLVIDIPGAQSTLRSIALPANRFGVTQARLGNSDGKLRLVFDAGDQAIPGYQVLSTPTGLRVILKPASDPKK
jgi:hypothetical protein